MEQYADYLRQYANIANEKNIDLGVSMCNFLVEILQGPCPGNQVEVCKTDILDTLEELSSIFVTQVHNIDQTVISKLHNSIIQILLGVLEGNDSQFVFRKIFLNTDYKLLQERLCQTYCVFMNEKYHALYDEETQEYQISYESLQSPRKRDFIRVKKKSMIL